jgi:transcriptional regulator with XRE-family HTH domain
MEDILSPDEIYLRARASGISISDLCKRAGVAHTTFYRWRAGESSPNLDVYCRLRDALKAAAA